VATEDVLARVRADLTAGNGDAALRRLRTLVAVDPDDLTVHRLLADVYRQRGDLVEAGRWGFLSPDVTGYELRAFERAHPSPWVRLRLLRWSGDPAALPATARERYAALAAAAAAVGAPRDYRGPLYSGLERRGDRRLFWAAVAALGTLGLFALVGAVQAVLFALAA
jgi:hypothetical protein